MLILKHVRNWSYEVLEREVRANVVYRTFCRIGIEKVPDEKTLVRLGQAIGGETVRQLRDRIVGLAQERRVIQGRTSSLGFAAEHKLIDQILRKRMSRRGFAAHQSKL
jgi:hypothetical protein